MNKSNEQETTTGEVSRRNFLKLATVTVVGGTGVVVAACQPPVEAPTSGVVGAQLSIANQYPEVPLAPAAPPDPNVLRFFTLHEARTVEALTARILPGTPADPGAREAGVVTYIDNLLSYPHGFAEVTYLQPPFAETYDEDHPQSGSYNVIWVPDDEIKRYGYQSILDNREVYRLGLAAVDRYANATFERDVIDLTEEEQDRIMGDLLSNTATGFTQFTPETFFHVLRRHTAEGLFSDPAYGGNREMIGWKLIGYPGAQRAYLPEDIVTEGIMIPPQSLATLPHFHPGQPVGPNTVLPVRGSEPAEQ